MSTTPGNNSPNLLPYNPVVLGPVISLDSPKETKTQEKVQVTEVLADQVEAAAEPSIPTHLPNGSAAKIELGVAVEPEAPAGAETTFEAPRATWSAKLESKINSWLHKGKEAYAQAKEVGARGLAKLNAGIHELGAFLMNLGRTLMNLVSTGKAHEPAERTAAEPASAAVPAPDAATADEIAKKNN